MKAQRTPIKHREHGESFENIVVNKETTKNTMKALRKQRKHCEPGVFFVNIVVNKETTKNTMKALRTLRKTWRTWCLLWEHRG